MRTQRPSAAGTRRLPSPKERRGSVTDYTEDCLRGQVWHRAPEGDIPATSPVKVKQTYSGKALKVVHRGAYREMETTYEKLMAFVAAHGYEPAGAPWDEYVSDPGNTPESELITNVYMPVR